jgi:hypothetical protein
MGINSSLPDGQDDAARKERERFEAQYKRYLEAARCVALTILVWGPNPASASPAAQKRKEIRATLTDLGHNAVFSEDLHQPGNMSLMSVERAQALASDMIVILIENAPGAIGEMHDFCTDLQIAPKVLVLAPERYRDGYSAHGMLRDLSDAYEGGVYWYVDEELTRCDVLSRVLKKASGLRNILFCRSRPQS